MMPEVLENVLSSALSTGLKNASNMMFQYWDKKPNIAQLIFQHAGSNGSNGFSGSTSSDVTAAEGF